MLEIIGTVLLILVALAIVVWLGVFIVGLVIGNKVRKRIKAADDPFFTLNGTRPGSMHNRASHTNWRDNNNRF